MTIMKAGKENEAKPPQPYQSGNPAYQKKLGTRGPTRRTLCHNKPPSTQSGTVMIVLDRNGNNWRISKQDGQPCKIASAYPMGAAS
jgi:hypothetical protein